jgi:RNA polymerase sigma-70 factor (ECF subfamily)
MTSADSASLVLMERETLPVEKKSSVAHSPAAETKQALETGLIQRILKGESERFYELMRPYERQVFRVAVAILKNDADAEEVAQEAVLKAFSNLSQFRGESKFSTWLIQITINQARLKLRKDRRHPHESVDEQRTDEEGEYVPKDFADWREVPCEALQRKELQQALKHALAGLAPKYREVIILRDVQQFSTRETAETLGISDENVKTRLLRARLQMRDALAPGIDGSWTSGTAEYQKVRPW